MNKMKKLTDEIIRNAVGHFSFRGLFRYFRLNESGHINDTFEVVTSGGHYILQRVNTKVFADPEEIQENIVLVSEWMKGKMRLLGKDGSRGTLTVVRTYDGHTYYIDDDENFWRAFLYLEGIRTYELAEKPGVAFGNGAALGFFEKSLADFPVEELKITIPEFHNTKRRYDAFEDAVLAEKKGRVKEAANEIADIRKRRVLASPLLGLPLRVTHNDPKLTNVVFDAETNEWLGLIDYDTIMPGYAIHDFGDAVRFACSSALENEPDLSKVHFVLQAFNELLQGYLSQTKDLLSKEEIRSLPFGCKQMIYEVAMRFLTDYLEGDVYFHVSHPTENLERARNQLALLKDLERQDVQVSTALSAYL
jgi:Ser/Thr protein kinase RdoA (MazF antagonist)